MDQDIETGMPVLEGGGGYSPKKVYALYVNPVNRHIAGMIGFLGPIEQIIDGRQYETHAITDMTEEEYIMISRSINANESMTFLGEDNRTIISRRILIDLLEGTFFDEKSNAIYGVDNIIRMRVRCVDNTETRLDDVQVIEVKNLKKMENPVSINGADPSVVKTTMPNPSEIVFEPLGTGVHTIRFKAKLPTVDYLWLTVYPQLLKLSDEDLEGLREWINSNQT